MQTTHHPIRPVFHVDMIGNWANQMIKYMVALNVVSLMPGCAISNVELPAWRISHPALPSVGGRAGPPTAASGHGRLVRCHE